MSPSNSNSKPSFRQTALKTLSGNPSQLGDPTSLKAETSSTSPTSSDLGASSKTKASSLKQEIKNVAPAPTEGEKAGKGGGETLRQKAMGKLEENPSMLGDPVSLNVETPAGGKSKL